MKLGISSTGCSPHVEFENDKKRNDWFSRVSYPVINMLNSKVTLEKWKLSKFGDIFNVHLLITMFYHNEGHPCISFLSENTGC